MPSSATKLGWADAAAGRLAAAGYRRGGARQAVIDLLERQDCALAAHELVELLRRSGRRVSRASVYRILEELEELDLVTRLELRSGTARFEASHPGGAGHHHHLLCDDCGDILPFADEELEWVIGRLSRRLPYDVSGHDVTLHGTCASCRAG